MRSFTRHHFVYLDNLGEKNKNALRPKYTGDLDVILANGRCCCDVAEDEMNLLKILNEENGYGPNNLFRLKTALEYKRTNLTDRYGKLYLTVDSLIRINNLITKSTNVRLRTVNVRPKGYEKAYMDYMLIEPALYGLIDNFNLGRITSKVFVDSFLKIHPFLDGNGRTCKVLFI